MTWEKLSSRYSLADVSEIRMVSLYDMCSNVMIDATQMTLFDNVLFQIDPTMT